MNFIEGEVLLINKPSSWTSFDVVNKIRFAIKKSTGERLKVGHAGTLDPLATGLLIICTGKKTKQIDTFTGMDKSYTGTFFIGATTPSYDCETLADKQFPTEHITEEMVRASTAQFCGTIMQTPPVYSAIKVDGKASYINARKGKEVKLQDRQVTISLFDITRIEMPEVDFEVRCSKGTYIRSLANDFGKALNSGAHLSKLCRTSIGEYSLENALSIEEAISLIEKN
jgi:tRNA pseudouridine55 synthase